MIKENKATIVLGLSVCLSLISLSFQLTYMGAILFLIGAVLLGNVEFNKYINKKKMRGINDESK
ncbi:hypothetical protein [Psychrobacillus sp. MER TA 171]|uniref:hypothetical protein n=1 Tax=Psychrobacillus sp. MER TA 171 TaxID=2939577 RepID=UPI002040E2EE|nr:hypothetical protein [Psychrobacillus sp. MER TA 171]MCM3358155.1 hypothetical protein [Psychrobacillus sp. MER TA 171]